MTASPRAARAEPYAEPRDETGLDAPSPVPRAPTPAPSSARQTGAGHGDPGDLWAGPQRMRATIRVDDLRWGTTNATTLTDIALTQLADGAHGTDQPVALDFLFTGDAALAELNARFRGKSGATNVLSFPSGEGPDEDGIVFLGSIALAFETCQAEARKLDVFFAHHATHLIVHGALHLLGHDHEEDAAADVMERIEVEILAKLGIANPYEGK